MIKLQELRGLLRIMANIKVIRDKELVKVVQDNLNCHPSIKYVNHLISEIPEEDSFYFWGGAVTVPLVNFFYNQSYGVNDFDILIYLSDHSFDILSLFKNKKNVSLNRFNHPKWRPVKDIEIDVCPADSFSKDGELIQPELEDILKRCDLTTGSIAYDPKNRIVYDLECLGGIKKKEVDILNNDSDKDYVLMTRLILQSDKLEFKIGPKGIAFIRENYHPRLNGKIREYLDYKKIPEEIREKVILSLESISGDKVTRVIKNNG